ncbi:P-loop NTPase family protein [Alkalithermobacter paradoxus]|uniref:Uncharacterized protein n=1 Tax=Alkalithermobacter paradoxus TaxID=29349 RepID=A0A1V4I8B5_9FIRM|nr:hypothetical protein CLOTH_06320 [[Clostridium] thermoalcaliphilum]
MNDAMLSHPEDLKLSGMVKNFDIRNEEAIKSNLSYIEFFELLLRNEVLSRWNNGNIKRI